jgi:hypothetical protein
MPWAAIGKIAGSVIGGGGGKSGGGKSGGGMLNGLKQKGGAGVGMIVGAGQMIAGQMKQKKADAMIPSDENVEQRALQRQFSRKKRAFETGTADQSQRTSLNQMMKSGVKESLKYGAGLKGLNAMNQIYSQGLNAIGESSKKDAFDYATKEGEMINTLAQRKLELGMERYDRAQARAAQLKTDGKRNFGSSVARLTGANVSGGGGVTNRRKRQTSTDGGSNSSSGLQVNTDGSGGAFDIQKLK